MPKGFRPDPRLEELKGEMAQCKEEISSLRREMDSLKGQKSYLWSQIEYLRTEISLEKSALSQYCDAHKFLHSIGAYRDGYKNDIINSKARLDDLYGRLKPMYSELDEIKEKMQRVYEELCEKTALRDSISESYRERLAEIKGKKGGQ